MKIGTVELPHPVALAPMAGMTDTAFRRLVKRQGGCGLVVTEMVSSEGLVRGIDRTLEYAEYTEEERPVSVQIFGGDPDKMAAAAQIVEGMEHEVILKTARGHEMDLIVIGSRGMGDATSFLLGSVSDKVAHRALCPVLIVR